MSEEPEEIYHAYIGKPPPRPRGRKRKRREQERELSPAVPHPEPFTPQRANPFDTPARSTRIFKTYAHNRARSSHRSARDEEEEREREEGEFTRG